MRREQPVRLEGEAEEPGAWVLAVALAWVSGATLALTACGQMPMAGYLASLGAGLGAIWVGRWP
jgi:hypothetical protein